MYIYIHVYNSYYRIRSRAAPNDNQPITNNLVFIVPCSVYSGGDRFFILLLIVLETYVCRFWLGGGRAEKDQDAKRGYVCVRACVHNLCHPPDGATLFSGKQ